MVPTHAPRGLTVSPQALARVPAAYESRWKSRLLFIIGEDECAFLRLRFGQQVPDFRYHTARNGKCCGNFWHGNRNASTALTLRGKAEDEYVIFNPDERLIEWALIAGLLRDAEETVLSLAGDAEHGIAYV